MCDLEKEKDNFFFLLEHSRNWDLNLGLPATHCHPFTNESDLTDETGKSLNMFQAFNSTINSPMYKERKKENGTYILIYSSSIT